MQGIEGHLINSKEGSIVRANESYSSNPKLDVSTAYTSGLNPHRYRLC